ncbi:MAG: HDIG domain-containing protein [Bacteroidales bacterium]|nr:HDIG domain-containing protein [Bacteroidales bacterium]
MRKLFSFVKDKYSNIFNGVLFMLTIAIVVGFLPREGKFKYEFKRGKPWMHETLIAPFDFPIYKSQQQIKYERDSILENFRPYFRYDSTIHKRQLEQFTETYNARLKEVFHEKYTGDELKEAYTNSNFEKRTQRFYNYVLELFRDVYGKGIVEVPEVYGNLDQDSEIVLIEDNLAEEHQYSEFYDQKEAYKYVISHVEQYVEDLNLQDDKQADFYEDLNFYDFIKPNVLYDQETSQKVRQSMLENVSITKGMVQAGERIVSEGEVVDSTAYRILESLQREYEQRLGEDYQYEIIFLGQFIFVFAAIFVLYLFLYHFRFEILQDSMKTLFILLLVILMVFVSSYTVKLRPEVFYIIPFAILPIIIRSFYDARLALFIHIITIMLIASFAPHSFEFIFLNFIAGIVAIFSLTSLSRRGKLFLSAAMVVVSYIFVYFGISITQGGNIEAVNWVNVGYFGINGALVLASYPLIFVFEKTFGFLSDVTLMELSDTNQPLLRRLSEQAPGTFQHSMQVASLAETAAYQIGGNTLLVRTGALYHDIGKMKNPIYFIENQDTDFNPHQQLEFRESAKIIINHVKQGVEYASRYKLPGPIVDFIRTHHGTTRVHYFYKKYLQEYNEDEVDESQFTYPGPKPFSKEMAALMMADAVEAASRSYSHLDEKTINNLVDQIIDSQLNGGQFENVDVTFREITIIRGIFKKKLQNFYHARIKYPK